MGTEFFGETLDWGVKEDARERVLEKMMEEKHA